MTIPLIINKKAKNAALVTGYLKELKENSIEVELYKITPKNLEKTIKSCIKSHSMILVGGGDGTIRTAAECCANTSTILGILPLGTLNHFAKELGLPSSKEELVQALITKTTLRIDVAEVNGSVFINNSSIGLYPSFAKKRDYYASFYNKWLSYIPSLFHSFKYHDLFKITLASKDLQLSFQTSFFLVSNNLYSYQFPSKVFRTHFNKALLGLYFFKQGKIRLYTLMRAIFLKKNSFEIKQSSIPVKITIANKTEVLISLDGDTFTKKLPLLYKSLPKALTLLVGKK